MPFLDLIILGIVGFLVMSMSNRRRGGGSAIERIRQQVQEAIRNAQGIPTNAGMAPAPRPVRPAPKKETAAKAEPAPSIDWHGLEGTASAPVQAAPVQAQPAAANPLPTVSTNPMVQAFVMAEILGKPRAGIRKRI